MSEMLWDKNINAESSPLRVLIKRGEFIDHNRASRAVPYKIYYPDCSEIPASEKFPIIIWSHGLGGTRDGASFIARYIAAHGYILVHIQHDGTDDSLWRNEPVHPWDAIRAKLPIEWDVVKNRYLDVPFALDELEKLIANDDALAPISDMSKLGMSGHSFGALTAQVMAGQAVGQNNALEFFKEDRFMAGILYSPVPNFRLKAAAEDIYGPIQTPLLHMTGTNDASPTEPSSDYTQRYDVYRYATGTDQHLFTITGADHMVFNGSRGKLEDYDGIDQDKDIIKITSLAWWDAFLKDNQAAMNWLKNNGIANWLGTDKAEYEYKNG